MLLLTSAELPVLYPAFLNVTMCAGLSNTTAAVAVAKLRLALFGDPQQSSDLRLLELSL